jgi:hypothetical protein
MVAHLVMVGLVMVGLVMVGLVMVGLLHSFLSPAMAVDESVSFLHLPSPASSWNHLLPITLNTQTNNKPRAPDNADAEISGLIATYNSPISDELPSLLAFIHSEAR